MSGFEGQQGLCMGELEAVRNRDCNINVQVQNLMHSGPSHDAVIWKEPWLYPLADLVEPPQRGKGQRGILLGMEKLAANIFGISFYHEDIGAVKDSFGFLPLSY